MSKTRARVNAVCILFVNVCIFATEPAGVEEALHTHRLSVEMELAPPAPRGMPRRQRDSILPGGFVVSTAGTLQQTIGMEEALPTSRQPLEMELAPPKPHGAARPQRGSVLPGGFVVSSEGTLKQNRISVDERAINEATVRDRVFSLTHSLTHSCCCCCCCCFVCVRVCVCACVCVCVCVSFPFSVHALVSLTTPSI